MTSWCDPPAPDLCDLCGMVVLDDTQLYTLVADPSDESLMAGQRLVSACCQEHLAELHRRYPPTPPPGDHVAADRVAAADGVAGDRVAAARLLAALSRLTGLTDHQITAGLRWLAEHDWRLSP